MKRFSVISAYAKSSRGIGLNNKLPWKFPEDMKFFGQKTQELLPDFYGKKNAVIMGRKTFESLPKSFKPLPNRLNIVVSSTLSENESDHEDLMVCNNFESAIVETQLRNASINQVFVIGGQSIYEQAIRHDDCEKIIITEIDDSSKPFECDTFFPKLPPHFKLTDKVQGNNPQLSFLTFEDWRDSQSDEKQYIELLNDILEKGEHTEGRNGNVISLFGAPQHCFDLRKGFPLLTTKRMPFDMIVEELLFFIRGDTNAQHLSQKGVRIWDGNTTREFLDNRGLQHYSVGDMGPMYGWNWRHFGANYKSCDTDYTKEGFDQLYQLVDNIVNNPNSRRLLLTTYDPSKVSESVLAPCHGLTIQFNVSGEHLDCKMYQRSVDTALGYPFNIASYAIFSQIIGHVTGLTPRYLYLTLGDTHLYKNHVEKIKRHFTRTPLKPPSMNIVKDFDYKNTSIEEKVAFMENLSTNDFKLSDYQYYPGIKMDMVA